MHIDCVFLRFVCEYVMLERVSAQSCKQTCKWFPGALTASCLHGGVSLVSDIVTRHRGMSSF